MCNSGYFYSFVLYLPRPICFTLLLPPLTCPGLNVGIFSMTCGRRIENMLFVYLVLFYISMDLPTSNELQCWLVLRGRYEKSNIVIIIENNNNIIISEAKYNIFISTWKISL